MLHTIRYKKIIVPKIPHGGSRVYSQLNVYNVIYPYTNIFAVFMK